jgi:hypothetical protein
MLLWANEKKAANIFLLFGADNCNGYCAIY